MTQIHVIHTALSDAGRREHIFAGNVLVFNQFPAVRALVEAVRLRAESIFAPHSPQLGQEALSPKIYLEKVSALQHAFRSEVLLNNMFRQALLSVGVDPVKTQWCAPTLRVQPAQASHIDRATASLGVHRDTWFCSVYQQNNWWLPIYDLTEACTLEFYPKYWKTPIKNNSAGWDLFAFREARKTATQAGRSFESINASYPLVTPQENIPERQGLKLLLEPGDMVCFSGAHLHRGVPNTEDKARISAEVRTINLEDVAAQCGAPNIDGASTGNALGDFYTIAG